jgi:hypothetical protein
MLERCGHAGMRMQSIIHTIRACVQEHIAGHGSAAQVQVFGSNIVHVSHGCKQQLNTYDHACMQERRHFSEIAPLREMQRRRQEQAGFVTPNRYSQ